VNQEYLMRNTDKDWRKVAEKEPYWGVLSVDRFRGRNLSRDDLDVFFRTGEQYVQYVLDAIRKFHDPAYMIERALDFGCGVGRLAIPIAGAAKGETVGVDIAPNMLKLCAEHARQRNISNLTLVEGDDDLSGVKGSFNFINTFLVLQHIPPARGVSIISNLIDRLEIGGVASLQMTYAKERRFLKHEEGRSPYYRRSEEGIVEIGAAPDARPEGSITMYDYDLNQVFAVIQRATTYPMAVRPTDDDGHIGVQVIVKRTR
jgi:SAM-dependent methyltransferase